MSLLTICQALAENVGLERPTLVMSSPDREWSEAVAMSNAVGEELARRVDFGKLQRVAVINGNDTDDTFYLGDDFSRIIGGVGVTFGSHIVRPLTAAEWATLTPYAGAPRYFLLQRREVRFWPYMRTGTQSKVRYQSKDWCSNGGAEWGADTDVSLFDETLMVKGLIVRWRRQKGMPYQDYEAEYEAALADIARFDDRSRLQ